MRMQLAVTARCTQERCPDAHVAGCHCSLHTSALQEEEEWTCTRAHGALGAGCTSSREGLTTPHNSPALVHRTADNATNIFLKSPAGTTNYSYRAEERGRIVLRSRDAFTCSRHPPAHMLNSSRPQTSSGTRSSGLPAAAACHCSGRASHRPPLPAGPDWAGWPCPVGGSTLGASCPK